MKELEVIINNIDGVNVVSSRDIANSFNKRHGDVIRSIEDKMEVNAILRSPNYFIESTYRDKSNRKSKEYLLTRDGFSFIVMGFTGVEADRWKIKYIEAFNNMEQQIKEQQSLAPIQEISGMLQDMKTLTERSSDNISKYESMLRVNCSKKTNFTRYIKNRLGIRKVNDEFEAVKSRVFCALGVSKWEDINLQQAESVLRLIDEGITEIIKNRPYEQINWF